MSEMSNVASAATECRRELRNTSRVSRAWLLKRMSELVEARRGEFVQSLVLESSKPVTLAEVEVTRARATLEISAEESRRFGGELLPMDTEWSGQNLDLAQVRWVPRGPVLGITPFNFPLNLVAHKVGPALASGNPIVIKPAPQTPGGALLLAEVFEQARLELVSLRSGGAAFPEAAFQVVCCQNSEISTLLESPAFETVSFTGSAEIGWGLAARVGRKKLLLELGGNAAVIIAEDFSSDADVARAVDRVIFGAFAYAGQTCISVQRVYVARALFDKFSGLLCTRVSDIAVGDPQDKRTLVGPMISQTAADRVQAWISEALSAGGRLLAGGKATGALVQPTVLSGVPRSCKIVSQEAFGPVVVVEPFDKFSDAITAANDSEFGLQAGVFTHSTSLIAQASSDLEVGGVLINEVPTVRADHAPYGGVKGSGLGREGVRYAMEEFSERRIIFGIKK